MYTGTHIGVPQQFVIKFVIATTTTTTTTLLIRVKINYTKQSKVDRAIPTTTTTTTTSHI